MDMRPVPPTVLGAAPHPAKRGRLGRAVILIAASLATVGGWIGVRPAAEPVPARMPPSSRAPAAVMPARVRAAIAVTTAPGTPPPLLAAIPDPALRTEAEDLVIDAVDARRRGDLRAALALLRTAVERAPAVETHAALGALYLELGVTSPAETHLRTAVEGDPRSADRWIALANALAMKPDPGAAAEALDRARAAESGLRITRNADGWLVREPPS